MKQTFATKCPAPVNQVAGFFVCISKLYKKVEKSWKLFGLLSVYLLLSEYEVKMFNVNHTNLGNVSLTSWDNAKGETKWLLVGKHGAAFFPTNEALIDAILRD